MFGFRMLKPNGLIVRRAGEFKGRDKARDVAYPYRMGSGFAGDVNRTHPFSVEPGLQDATYPVLGYGHGVLAAASGNTIRRLVAGDAAITALYGISVRPFPFQQATDAVGYGSIAIGAAVPPATGVIDVLRSGYIMVPVYGDVVKGGAVYVRVQNAAPGQPVGGFESADDGTNTAGPITGLTFNGPAGADDIGELVFNI